MGRSRIGSQTPCPPFWGEAKHLTRPGLLAADRLALGTVETADLVNLARAPRAERPTALLAGLDQLGGLVLVWHVVWSGDGLGMRSIMEETGKVTWYGPQGTHGDIRCGIRSEDSKRQGQTALGRMNPALLVSQCK